MNELVQKMRAARETWVPIDKRRSICVLRPRWEDLVAVQKGQKNSEFVSLFAVNWKGFTEADLMPSGGDVTVPFDAEVCAEWLADHPKQSQAVGDFLIKACNERIQQEAEAEKN